MDKLEIFLDDILAINGSLIDFRIYDTSRFTTLITRTSSTNKKVYGLDTFCGLDKPNIYDLLNPNHGDISEGKYIIQNVFRPNNSRIIIKKTNHYNDLDTIIPEDERFCFALLDLKQFSSTEKVLQFIWDKMSYGGTLYVYDYDSTANHSSSYAISHFIKKYDKYLNISRQMVVDGNREKFIAIKCFNPLMKPILQTEAVPREKVTIAMVLKTGGKIYDYNYVNALAKGLKKNLTINHEIVCLTDDATGFSNDIDRVILLANDYPTWWSKIELFKEGQFDTKHVFYLDLDTIVVDNIDEIVSYNSKFSGLRDFYGLHSLGSGLMSWNTDYVKQIYTNFAPIAKTVMATYRAGDQKWIDEQKPSIDYFQDRFPNEILSYKRHCVDSTNNVSIPSTAKIICFHGNPRPHTVKHPSIMLHWQP
jgi:hypothetical protein